MSTHTAFEDYEAYDALGLAALVARGETTPEALLEAALQRTEARDAKLGAVVVRMFDEARAAIARGLPEGPFRGVPFLLKDLHLAWPGVPLTNGSKLFENYVPDFESELSARYRRAGLVVFGKSASPELGLTTTTESTLFGATRNPWNPEHSAGGSSGGAAAAVAAGLLPLANASDGGGSIRIPASCCGLFGMKPTRGRTPFGPQSGEGWSGMSVMHAVSRSVRDSAALLDVCAGPDPGAPYAAQAPVRPFFEEVGAEVGTLRIALQTTGWNNQPTEPGCEAAARDAAKLCEELGHRVSEARFEPGVPGLSTAPLTIMSANTRVMLEDRARALGRELEEGDVEPGTLAISQECIGQSAQDYVRALHCIHAAGRALARFMNDYDVILTPVMATPPPPIGVLSLSQRDAELRMKPLLQSIAFTQMSNICGNPAMSVPLSWNGDGLPIGVQFMGRMNDEATLFRLAAQLEKARPWFAKRPPGLAATR